MCHRCVIQSDWKPKCSYWQINIYSWTCWRIWAQKRLKQTTMTFNINNTEFKRWMMEACKQSHLCVLISVSRLLYWSCQSLRSWVSPCQHTIQMNSSSRRSAEAWWRLVHLHQARWSRKTSKNMRYRICQSVKEEPPHPPVHFLSFSWFPDTFRIFTACYLMDKYSKYK